MKLPPDLERKVLELAGVAPAPAPAKAGHPALVAPASASLPGGIAVTVPVYVVAGDNARGGRAKIGRAGHERRAVAEQLARHLRALAPLADAAQDGRPVRCRLVRLGGPGMDTDGLAAACKYVRDTVALFLGVGDGPRGPVRWAYDQEPGPAFGVRIELTEDRANG